jgi:DNA-binding CsgD family transcriptional regulator
MRPLKRDVARIRAIRSQLETIHFGRPILEDVLPAIGELINTEKTIAFSLAPKANHLEPDAFLGAGFDIPGVREGMRVLMREDPVGWTAYNAFRPEPEQRNVAIDCARRFGWGGLCALPVYRRVLLRHQLKDHDQLRVLVCEGKTLLAFVGGWRHDELFSDYERQLLQAVTPALQQRLRLERQMRDASATEAALEAALDAIPGDVYVLDARARVQHANAAGRRQLDAARRDTTESLCRALREPEASFQVTRFGAGGALVVRRGSDRREARVEAARVRFSLTRRQTEVLGELAKGRSNAEIAAELRCSPATVEVHLRTLFAKLDCDSRAGLLARLLE